MGVHVNTGGSFGDKSLKEKFIEYICIKFKLHRMDVRRYVNRSLYVGIPCILLAILIGFLI